MFPMLKVFIGFDPRQPVSYTVLQQSIFTRSSKPVAITPLVIEQLPIKREGLTPFTFTRFLVPWLCNYQGWALFLDIDMILLDDISKLFNYKDDKYAVMVSKNEKRFEWASAMLFNCEKCKILTPEYIETAKNLHGIDWADCDEIGAFPSQWNHLVGYDKPRTDAKLVHYTQGVPFHREIEGCEYSNQWHYELTIANYSEPWVKLMGNSVHSTVQNGKIIPKLKADIKH